MKNPRYLGEWPRRLLWVVGGLFLLEAAIWFGILDEYWTLTLVSICINVILAVSLNLINGFTGQFSLGHAGFMAVGGYTAAVLGLKIMPPLIKAGAIPTLKNLTVLLGFLPPMSFPLAKALFPGGVVLLSSTLLGGLLAALMGFLIGLPTLRLRGDYLAIATLGFGEIIRLSILNVEYLGGATGLPNIPQYTTVAASFVFAALTVILLGNLIRSTHGRAMMAVREDEIAAEAMGINTTRYKVAAFTIGAFFAGVAGALYAHTYYVVNPRCFSFMKTIDILVMVVLGGQGSMPGAIMGAVLVTVLNAFLGDLPTVRMIVYALFLVILMIFLPRGLLTIRDLLNLRLGPKEGDAVDASRHG
ncbi:MAG: branched-chain amino acid ABC transporter permease [Bacillota bacterium]